MQFWMWGMGPAKATTINERYACRDTSPEVSAILGSAVGHPGRGVPTEFSFGSFITEWRHPSPYNINYTTSVHFWGKEVGSPRGLSHFWSQMTPSQRPILKPQFSKVEWYE